MKNIIMFTCMLCIIGCSVSNNRKIVSPSGNTAYVIECKGNIINCIEDISKLCPSGYNIKVCESDTAGICDLPFNNNDQAHIVMIVECCNKK